MGNSWKAKCVEILNDNGWKIGDIIEVVDGIVVGSKKHGWGGNSSECVKSFENWRIYQSDYTKWELITDEPVAPSTDNINPSHYKSQCSLECIEAMQMAFGSDVVYYFCICNAWKYMWRYQNKNGLEDLNKADWYLNMAEKVDSDKTEHINIQLVLEQLKKKTHDN